MQPPPFVNPSPDQNQTAPGAAPNAPGKARRAYESWARGDGAFGLGWKPETTFALLVLGFGLLFACGMPPCQVPDEVSHWYRAYQVSEAKLFPVMVNDWGGGEMPAGVACVVDSFSHLPFHGHLRARGKHFRKALDAELGEDDRRRVEYPGAAFYTFVPYLPQAVGIAAARAVGIGPLGLFYAGRLANLALAVMLIYLAVRITPVFKVVLGMVALLPMSVHQLASLSPDSSTLALSFLLTAVFFRLALDREFTVCRSAVVAMLCLAGWVALCKFPYAAITLLYFAIPAERMGGWRRYLLVGCTLFLIVGALAFASTRMKRYCPDRLTTDAGAGVSMERQLGFIRSKPLRYGGVVAATIAEHGQVWLDQMGTLGWLDTPVNPLAMHVFFIVLVLAALADRAQGVEMPLRLKIVAFLAAGACAGVILTSCYVCGCRYKAPLIVGPQGRYFIPLLPLLLVLLYNRAFQVVAHPRLVRGVAAGAAAGVLLVAVAAFVRRYYFAPRLHEIVTPLALLAGLAVCTLVIRAARRRIVET